MRKTLTPAGEVRKIHSTSEFVWNGRTGVTVASDMGYPVRVGLPDHLFIESTKTGEQQVFWFEGQDVVDGDLLSTTYLANSGVRVQIFND